MPPSARGSRAPEPPALVVERLTFDGEELALFSWQPEIGDASMLSASERAVLEFVASGASNTEIAKTRATSVHTVANQVAAILKKTRCRSRFDLIRKFAGTL